MKIYRKLNFNSTYFWPIILRFISRPKFLSHSYGLNPFESPAFLQQTMQTIQQNQFTPTLTPAASSLISVPSALNQDEAHSSSSLCCKSENSSDSETKIVKNSLVKNGEKRSYRIDDLLDVPKDSFNPTMTSTPRKSPSSRDGNNFE